MRLIFGLLIFLFCTTFRGSESVVISNKILPKPPKTYYSPVTNAQLADAKKYCKEKGFNTKVAFFSNMSIRSGKNRFFIVDLENDSILNSGLVTHGHCQNYASVKPSFSNVSGSNCTSLGHYKIGYKYDGRFGTAYKLYGLDKTNSNAFDRFVVLHSHSCVPDYESAVGICRSEGCPTVSPYFLSELGKIIDASSKPVMLWIYTD